MTREEYYEDFIGNFTPVYRKAKEMGVDFELVNELVIEVYKIVVRNNILSSKIDIDTFNS